MYKQYLKYWKDHPHFNAVTHVAGGLGLGLVAYGYFGSGAVTWGWLLILVWAGGHLWPLWQGR